MRLSIIIPAYNEENYLPATLDAINGAITDDVEVIVVDNLSTDATRQIAEERGATVITEMQRNIGKVRNTGAGRGLRRCSRFHRRRFDRAAGHFRKDHRSGGG